MTEIKTTAEVAEAAVLNQAGAVHTDPNMETTEQRPLPEGMTAEDVENKSPAQWAYERIILYIQNFEEDLDADHEVGMGFAGSDGGTLHIQGMGFFAPDIVTFYGVDSDGVKTQLIQHVSQLNVMLRAATKQDDDVEAARIGFHLTKKLKTKKTKKSKK